ncbi:MAG: helix-turn-helix transcriptional regulator [Lachnospiraceae bacterium]|jgi:transcriptional regulator with XRE-family HTH domain|nr:helix-turn-helix transcriptional regulator [Lachnospiraceae bacterium]MBQ5476044.1 helix-turn-helix transcriptional regulator [Lachnospiraceae bacterium]
MGYGSELKRILDKKHIKVSELARETGISPTTIYSSIQRDSSIRYDYALKISEYLNISAKKICGNVPAGYHKKDEDLDLIIDSYRHLDKASKERLLKYIKKLSS